jgi:membrane protein DedA with SNARE-associated domain
MKSRILCCTILLSALPGTAVLAHTGHIADAGEGHSHWLALAALAGAAAIGAAAWLRWRADRRIARDRKL